MLKYVEKIIISAFIIVNLISFLSLDVAKVFYNLKFIMIVLVAFILFSQRIITKKPIIINKINAKLFKTGLIWVGLLGFSLFQSENLTSALLNLASYLLLLLLAFIIIPSSNVDIISYNNIWLWSVTLVFAFAILMGLLSYTSLSYINPSDLRIRYNFSFINPNSAALFAYLGVMETLTLCIIDAMKKRYIATMIFFLIVVYLSDSRTPLLALVIGVLFYTLSLLITKLRVNSLVFITVSLMGMWVALIILFGYLQIPFSRLNELSSFRLANWNVEIQQLSGIKWLVGFGLDAQADSIIVANQITFDSSYIQQLIRTGLLGFLGMSGFIITTIRSVRQIDDKKVKRFALSMLLAWLFYGITENPFFAASNATSVYIWTNIGLLIHNFTSLNSFPK
ncbi:MAG TPA: hypothetical protein VFC84_13990, partial [Desulfosporosinus sp.]|nr:hypothetical protein [Desulfosporosinus sp.]